MKYLKKLQQFMQGRYGIDELYNFLLNLYIIIFITNLFLKSNILNILELLLILIMFYRFLSKNIYTRQKENKQYLKLKAKALKPFANLKRNYQDREYHVYKKCKHCKSTLKLPLPSKRGIQHVKCPKCKKRIRFICLRQEKVEVIKPKKK